MHKNITRLAFQENGAGFADNGLPGASASLPILLSQPAMPLSPAKLSSQNLRMCFSVVVVD